MSARRIIKMLAKLRVLARFHRNNDSNTASNRSTSSFELSMRHSQHARSTANKQPVLVKQRPCRRRRVDAIGQLERDDAASLGVGNWRPGIASERPRMAPHGRRAVSIELLHGRGETDGARANASSGIELPHIRSSEADERRRE